MTMRLCTGSSRDRNRKLPTHRRWEYSAERPCSKIVPHAEEGICSNAASGFFGKGGGKLRARVVRWATRCGPIPTHKLSGCHTGASFQVLP